MSMNPVKIKDILSYIDKISHYKIRYHTLYNIQHRHNLYKSNANLKFNIISIQYFEKYTHYKIRTHALLKLTTT